MKTMTLVKAIPVLAATVLLGTATMHAQTSGTKKPSPSSGAQKTLTGVVSDAMCGAMHMAKDKSAAECTQMCVHDGQKYALVAGKKVYTLEGHEAELKSMAAKKVTVRGTINGNTISVDSVAPAAAGKKPSTPPGN